MSSVLEIRDLSKTYRKPQRLALDAISLEVTPGAIYAFVGPNGAGKTTAIRIISSLLSYDGGSVRVCGDEVATHKRETRQRIGYIPDEFGFYDDMVAREYLEFFSRCYGIDPEHSRILVNDLVELVGLADRSTDPINALSRGMRQRLGLARALINDPELIIADEPAASLDPRARVDLRDMFRLLRDMGKTIFISSHILRELDDIATHMGVIENGKMKTTGMVDDVRQKLRSLIKVRLSVLGDADNVHAWLAQQEVVRQVTIAELTQENSPVSPLRPMLVVLVDGNEITVSHLLADMIRMGFPVYSYAVELDNLENIFLQLTKDLHT